MIPYSNTKYEMYPLFPDVCYGDKETKSLQEHIINSQLASWAKWSNTVTVFWKIIKHFAQTLQKRQKIIIIKLIKSQVTAGSRVWKSTGLIETVTFNF